MVHTEHCRPARVRPLTDQVERRWAHNRKGPLQRLRNAFNPLPVRGGIGEDLFPPNYTDPDYALPEPAGNQSMEQLAQEAEGMFIARKDQALRAEARATSLQGAAGIAIGLVLTGAAFLLDPSKIGDRGWRIALTVAYQP